MRKRVLTATSWLHPVVWFLITILIKYAMPILNGSISLDHHLALYLIAVILLIAPLLFFLPWREKLDLSAVDASSNVGHWFLWLILLFIYLFKYSDWTYVNLQRATPFSLQIFEVGFVILSAQLLHGAIIKNKALRAVTVMLVLGSIFLHIGSRDWIVVVGILVLVVIHNVYRKLSWHSFLTAIFLFLVIVAPMTVILRTSFQDPDYNDHPLQQIEHELTRYDQFIGATFSRLGAEGKVLYELTKEGRITSTEAHPLQLLKETGNAFLPSSLRYGKKELRPGTIIYDSYIASDVTENKGISYPSGIIGDSFHYLGIYAFLFLPMLSLVMIVVWRYVGQLLIGFHAYAFMLFFYQYVFWDNHLIFVFTSWTRGLVIILIWLTIFKMITVIAEHFQDKIAS